MKSSTDMNEEEYNATHFFQTVQTIPPPHPFLFSLSSPFSSLFPSPFGVGVAWDGVSLIEMGLGDWPTFELDHLHIEVSA